MLQDEWLAKMKICGQTERVWAALVHARGTGDEVSPYQISLRKIGAYGKGNVRGLPSGAVYRCLVWRRHRGHSPSRRRQLRQAGIGRIDSTQWRPGSEYNCQADPNRKLSGPKLRTDG